MKSPRRTWQCDTGAVVPMGTGSASSIPHPLWDNPARAHRLEAGACHLLECGERTVAEFLKELAASQGIPPDALLDSLDTWRGTLPAANVRAVISASGGRQFSPRPLRVVP